MLETRVKLAERVRFLDRLLCMVRGGRGLLVLEARRLFSPEDDDADDSVVLVRPRLDERPRGGRSTLLDRALAATTGGGLEERRLVERPREVAAAADSAVFVAVRPRL